MITIRGWRDTGGPATDFQLLLTRIKAGDADAAGELLWPHRRRVWGIAYSLLQHKQDTEDVVQETFLRAFRSVKNLEARDQKGLEVWLVRIAINCAKDFLRTPRSQGIISIPDSADERVLAVADQTAMNLRLQELLRDLPFAQRSAAVLVDMYGFTRQEAAAMLGIPKGTIDSSLFSARTKLRKGWEAEHV